MFKRIRRPGWVVLFALSIIVIIGIGKGSQAVINAADNKVETKIENKESSKYPGLNLKTETNEAKTYTSSISTPITESEEINKPIHKWLKEQEDEFFAEMELNEEMLGKGYRAHLNIQVDTKKVTENIYSLIFNSYQLAGGANGINIIKTFIVDTANNKVLKLNDLMNLDDEGIEAIRSLVMEQLEENEDIYFYVIDDLLEEALKDLESKEWSISKKSFTIYFDEYEIAAGAAGAIQVNIPLEKLTPYIKENIAVELNLPKEQEEEEIEEHKPKEVDLDPDGKYVALTFDDGPSSEVTPRILKTLKEYDAIATFFMLGSQVEYYPKIARQVAEDGHEIANHTESHIDLTTIGIERVRQELAEAREKIKTATGQDPTLIRPPYGAYNDNVIKTTTENQESIILWSVDSLDWKNRNASAINEAILRGVGPGSIVLMHDIHSSTADALPALMNALEKEGYQFITVSQILSLQEANGVGPYFGE